ncbi:MAG: helix-turn-helix domain-containing protein [Sulfolobales archaeon]
MSLQIDIPRCKLPSGKEVSIIDVIRFFFDLSETDITILLKILWESPKTLEELSREVSMSKASVSRSIAKLHAIGFVSRRKITGKNIRGRPRYVYEVDREKVVRELKENVEKCSSIAMSVIEALFGKRV